MRPLPIPEDVAALASEFAVWRRQRPHQRAHVPDELMRKAVAAARTHSVNAVARGIKFDRRRLRIAVERGGGNRAAVGKAPAAPVRLLPVRLAPAAAAGGTVVEIEDPSGWRLKLTGGDASAALKAFVEARR